MLASVMPALAGAARMPEAVREELLQHAVDRDLQRQCRRRRLALQRPRDAGAGLALEIAHGARGDLAGRKRLEVGQLHA
ncbi:hypothetical protein D3C83_101080 [compost metagenome]